MSDRNIEARRLIQAQLDELTAKADKADRRRRSLQTQTSKNKEEIDRIAEERSGLSDALTALGGRIDEEAQE